MRFNKCKHIHRHSTQGYNHLLPLNLIKKKITDQNDTALHNVINEMSIIPMIHSKHLRHLVMCVELAITNKLWNRLCVTKTKFSH